MPIEWIGSPIKASVCTMLDFPGIRDCILLVHVLYYHSQVVESLKRLGRGDILVVCGGVIPPQDHQFLYDAGVTAVYGPGTNIPEAASHLVDLILSAQQSDSPNTQATSSQH